MITRAVITLVTNHRRPTGQNTYNDDIKREVSCVVEWFVMDSNTNYHNYYSTLITEQQYCDMLINEVQKQLLKWVSEQQTNYSK